MAAPINTVLDKKNYPKYMMDQLKDVGTVSRYAFSHGVNRQICEGIAADVARDLGCHSDIGAYYRVETGFNAAQQFLGALEDAVTRTKLRFKDCTEQAELFEMRDIKGKFLDMIHRRTRDMDKHFSDPHLSDGGATYRKIRDSYMPVIDGVDAHVEQHIWDEMTRVSREEKERTQQRTPEKPRPA